MQATARHLRGLLALACVLAMPTLGGCLGAPEIEDQWTRLDVVEVESGAIDPVTDEAGLRVRGRITFRSILTGSLIMEIRSSETLGAKDVDLRDEADRLVTTRQIQTLLESTGASGGSSRAVTGFDRLIQEVDFYFPGGVPAAPAGGAVFAVFYFGDVEEVREPGGGETVVITARDFESEHILPGAYVLAEGN
ncbi:MAG: hypothetical protein R3E97_16145 [Candidatus Eisenbacteria bacterium]